jgi:RND superfamily putative drug exporter
VTGVLYRVGHLCGRHRYPTLVIWIVALVALVVLAKATGAPTNNNLRIPGTDSTRAQDLLNDKLPNQANGTNPVVMEAPSGKLTQGKNKAALKATYKSLKKAPYVQKAVSPLSEAGADALSKDETIAYISLTLHRSASELTKEQAERVIDAEQPAVDAGFTVATGGYLGQAVSKPKTESSEVVGLTAAALILMFTFGTVVAMGLPIATAILGVIAGLAAMGLIGNLIQVPTVGPTLGIMMGLGVGIDYSLFIITRHRGFMEQGHEPREAAARAVATAGGAVVFAGSTVIVALCSLTFAGIPLVSALGYTAAVVVAIAVAAAITLLPALLSIVGMRIERLRVPFVHPPPHDHRPHGWARWAHGVADRAWPAIGVAVAILLVLAVPVRNLELGQQDNGEEPTSETIRIAYDLLTKGFGPGVNGPFLVAVKLQPPAHNDNHKLNQLQSQEQKQKQQEQSAIAQQTQALVLQGVPQQQAQQEATQQVEAKSATSAKQQRKLSEQEQFLKSTASDPRLVKLENKISKTGGVKSVSQAKVDKPGDAAVFNVTATTPPSANSTEALVRHLRSTVVPDALKGTDVKAYVGGQTAGYIDLADRISDKLPSVIAIVIALSFVLLLIAFRTLVVPLTAGLMNLLSVAAAYGVLTFVFQEGHGATLIGLDHAVPIVSFVPLLMFAILFGLSMDYQVFLLTRVQEHWLRTKDNREAVVDGLASSARVITSAALIMVSVFASFILNGDPTVKEFGLGLSVAIAVDATIVRCLLVPAVMVRLGRANWWIPGWLGRVLPPIGIEGEGFFEGESAADKRVEHAEG